MTEGIKESMMTDPKLRRRIRNLILLFIVGLVLSGVTALPIETELALAYANISSFSRRCTKLD